MKYILLIFLIFPTIVFAQNYMENFELSDLSDWEQSTANAWEVSTVNPISGNASLHHAFDNSVASFDMISHSLSSVSFTGVNVVWQFQVKHGYAPSSGNNWSFFLIADANALEMKPDGNISAFVVGVNLYGSDDLLKIWKLESGNETVVLETNFNWETQVGTNVAGIEVQRSAAGEWKIFVDTDGGFNNLVEQGSALNTFQPQPSFLGIFYEYSSAQDKKLWIDDISLVLENQPPIVQNIFVESSNSISVQFSENVTPVTAQNTSNYTLQTIGGNNIPVTNAVLVNETTVQLTTSILQYGDYQLSVSNIQDISGQIMLPAVIPFTYEFSAGYGSVVFNEIMCDPTPPQLLPEEEYIEIFNNTNNDIDLTNWTITIGTSTKTLSSITLLSGEFALIVHESLVSIFQPFGKVIGVESLSTLTNSGQNLILKNANGTVISEVNYSISWYNNSEKDDGGWSLEKIDPQNLCGGANNWKASISNTGGTPCAQNSVFAENIDNEAPSLIDVKVETDYTLKISFSEYLEETSALNPENYSVSQNISSPIAIEYADNNSYLLTFSEPFSINNQYVISISEIADECGNSSTNIEFAFEYYIPQLFDILITEIMADESPAVMLPEYEYIELFNNTEKAINLTDWQLIVGDTYKTLPATIIQPQSFLVICESEALWFFQSFGNAVGLSSLSITNGGQVLSLQDDRGNLVCFVNFSTKWYHDEYKAEGGWSLEMIDIHNPCGELENWSASVSELGGTPASTNSVADNNLDNVSPFLLRAAPTSANSLRLFFSEIIDTTIVNNLQAFEIDHNFSSPSLILAEPPIYKSLILNYSENFQENTIYSITVPTILKDCVGNEVGERSANFAIPSEVENSDLLINEILFNPNSDGSDFAEIYNNSNKVFDMKDLRIANAQTEDGWENVKVLSEDEWLIFPEEFYSFTIDKENITTQYFQHDANKIIEVETLPSFSDDAGTVTLLTKSLEVIDEMTYDKDMQFQLLSDLNGVSLERIHYSAPSHLLESWHSAATSVGYATPSLENSQFKIPSQTEDEFIIENEVFSPDNDGFDDFLTMDYNLENIGFLAKVRIFNNNGVLVRNLVNNELLDASGQIIWDGITDENLKAPVGIYLIFIELTSPTGTIKIYKKPCVLATKF